MLTSGGTSLGVWRLPHDPSLPGLVAAMDVGAVAGLLSACGVPTRPEDVSVRLRSYRPRRRAVVEVTPGGAGLFLEVVPPEDARALHDRHRELAAAGVPAARSLGVDPRGVVVLQRLGGRSWRQTLREGLASPPAEELWRAVDRLPDRLLMPGPQPPAGLAAAHRGVAGAAQGGPADDRRPAVGPGRRPAAAVAGRGPRVHRSAPARPATRRPVTPRSGTPIRSRPGPAPAPDERWLITVSSSSSRRGAASTTSAPRTGVRTTTERGPR